MKNDNSNRGSILAEQAYALGKMLNHEEWHTLPRNITPSDIDMVFDNNGMFLLCELKQNTADWQQLKKNSYGQWLLYSNLVLNGQGKHLAACVQHVRPEQGKAINTMTDVIAFQVMACHKGRIVYSAVIPTRKGEHWRRFVECFYSLGKSKF